MLLSGKRALIFGVANERSIATGVARLFRDQGARLGFSYARDAIAKRIHPIADELGGEFVIQCDLTRQDHLDAAVQAVDKAWGGVDVLVHSVAFADRDDLMGRYVDTSFDGFMLAMNVSVYTLVAACRAFEPLFGPGSSIMTMSYHASRQVIPHYNVMGVAKAALEASVRYLANDLGPQGIRVNALSPGPVKTLAASGIRGFKDILRPVADRAPLKRNPTPEDVGGAAVFLASDLAAGVTGEVMYVDCGFNVVGLTDFKKEKES